MKSRRAVSIIEVLVALVVFSIAALGSAAALTMSARAQRSAVARREALSALRSQAELLAAAPCAILTDGQGAVNAVTVHWTVSPSDSLTLVTLTATHAGTRTLLRIEVACE